MSSQPTCRRVAPAAIAQGLDDRGGLVKRCIRVDTGIERTLAVAAGVNQEMRCWFGRSHVLLIPLVGVAPGRNVVWIDRSERRVVLARAIGIIPQPPSAIDWIIGECDALGN